MAMLNLPCGLVALIFGVMVQCQEGLPEIPEDLKIETISKPDPCEKQAADGDMLVIHYSGFLEKDNTKFDSRYVSTC